MIWIQRVQYGNSLGVQWLGLCAATSGGMGSIPGRGTKIPQVTWRSQKTNKQNTNKQKIKLKNKAKNPHRGSSIYFSLVPPDCVSLSLWPPLFGYCWTNTKCRKRGSVWMKSPAASSSVQRSSVGKGNMVNVDGRWFFTWGSKSKTE